MPNFSSVQFSSINSSTYTMVSEVVPVGLLKEVFSLHTKTVLWRLRTSANVPEDLFQTIGAATHRHREGSVGPKTDILTELRNTGLYARTGVSLVRF